MALAWFTARADNLRTAAGALGLGLDAWPTAVRTIGRWEGLPGGEPPYAAGVSWLSRLNDRMIERELRESWRRALVRAVVSAVLAGAAGALFSVLLGRSWLFGALLCAYVSFLGTMIGRGFALLDARSRARHR